MWSLTFTASGLPAGLTIDAGTGEITGTIANSAYSSTPQSVTVVASDGQASSSQTFSWTIGSIQLTDPADQTNLDGDSVLLGLTALDASNGELRFSASGLPAGLSINGVTGMIDGTISDTADADSPYSVTVMASDGAYSSTQTFNWTVSRVTLGDPGDQSNFEGATVSFGLASTDNLATPTYSATGLPTGLSVNSSTGVISGTIAASAHNQSPYQVTVTASDGSRIDSQSFVWTVTPEIALVGPGPQATPTGGSVSLSLSATDHSEGTLSYSATGLPSGLTINSSTGLISGTATASGTSTATITVTDGTDISIDAFTWTDTPIVLPVPADQYNFDNDTVSLSAAASYDGLGILTYSASRLPSGLSINSSTGLISGTISSTADADGPYTPTVTASNGTTTVSQSFNWKVDPIISISDEGDQTNVPGDSVSVAISASDAASGTPTVTFSASGLPAGLSINSATGVVSGTITAAVSDTANAVTITATGRFARPSKLQFIWPIARGVFRWHQAIAGVPQ